MPGRPQPLRVCSATGPPGCIENGRSVVTGCEHEGEEIATDSAGFGCNDSLDGIGGHGSVDRVATECHDLERSAGRRW